MLTSVMKIFGAFDVINDTINSCNNVKGISYFDNVANGMFSSAQENGENGLPPSVTIGVGTVCGIVIVILVVVIVYLSRRRRYSPGQLF